MLRLLALACTALVFSLPAAAADAPDAAAHQAAMQKLSFLAGEWEGGGSMAMGPGPRETFVQTERIQFKHDGTLLLIEGNGKSPATGKTVHDALAVVTFDPKAGAYKFRSFAAVGRFADTDASVDGNTFVWNLKFGPQHIRYTINVAGGVWREIGERSANGGPWQPFFEMTLKKK
jgi:hypothetical protein